jgi:hypothetical protein
MPWTSTVVTREKLYEEVWAEPMVKVAKRYGVSDVALRKVCVKLSVPLPARGYWAKVANGKPTSRPRLPSVANAPQHVFQRNVVPVDEELQARLAQVHRAREAEAAPSRAGSAVTVETVRANWHRLAKRTANAVRNEFPRLPGSWQFARGPRLFTLYTSKYCVERALRLLDFLLRLCEAEGLEVNSEASGEKPALLVAEGHSYHLRFSERANRVERELTAQERDALIKDRSAFLPNRITKEGSGKLRLEVLTPTGSVVLSRSDTRHQRLEDVLREVPSALRETSIEKSVRDALSKERWEREEAERQRRKELIDIKNKQLERLKQVEDAANQWLRSHRLQRYAKALHGRAEAPNTTAEERTRLVAEAEWTERAAAWLDPLVTEHWPEVDDAPTSVYGW